MMNPRFMDAAGAALDALGSRHDIEYGDVRVAEHRREHMRLSTGELHDQKASAPALRGERAIGLCVRVLRGGVWGVATALEPGDEAAWPATAEQAANLAWQRAGDAASQATERVRLAEDEPQVGSHATAVDLDPFAVPGEQRERDLGVALAALDGLTSAAARIVRASATHSWERIDSLLCSTSGTRVAQSLVTSGAGLEIVAMGPDGPVTRSWPARGELAFSRAGHEYIDELGLAARALGLGEQALELALAPPCPADTTALIVDSAQLAVQIRETCALPSLWTRSAPELVSIDRLGRVRLGSPLVDLRVDGRMSRGAATAGWDDEGVPARVTPLVSRGVIVGYQTSRATAERAGLGRSSGAMRAPWCDQPPVLASGNVILEPDERGPSSVDELIADTDRGILTTTSAGAGMSGARHEFACEAAWQIERGKRVRLLRAPLYTATASGLWRRCDAVASADAFTVLGLRAGADGLAAGFGCAPARFRDVTIGSWAGLSSARQPT